MFSRRTDWKLTQNSFTEAQHELAVQGAQVIDLAVSNPTQVVSSYDTDEILQALASPAAMGYFPDPKGVRSAREAVVRYYREQHAAFDLDPESLVLTTSTSEGYSHIFRLLCNHDDGVFVPKPSYPLFDFLADLEDVRLMPYPLVYDHGWQIDFPSLYKAVDHRTRAVVMVHPNNPTGSYASEKERQALNDFCREYDLALIVDEVFLDYPVDGATRPTFATNGHALTFTLSGVSKVCGLPQMKLAWLAVSGPADRATTALHRLEVMADTYLSVSTPIQLAAPVLLDQRRGIQPLLLDRVRQNLAELDLQLSRQKTCERLHVDGGWYAVMRVPATMSDEDIAIGLLRECSVLVHPGHFYDFPIDGHLVVSLITQPEDFRVGLARALVWLNR